MLNNPRLKHCYRAQFIDDDKVLLLTEKDSGLITGKIYSRVLSRIQHDAVSPQKLVQQLEGELSPLEVYYALDALEKAGYITEDTPHLPAETCAYWNSRDIDVAALQKVLQEKPVTLEALNGPVPPEFSRAFADMGIVIADDSGSGVLRIIVTDDYQRPPFREINRRAIQNQQPWMLIKPRGVECWLGPIFIPGKTACWQCLKQRLEINRPLDAFFKAQAQSGAGNTEPTEAHHPEIPMGSISHTVQTVANLAALEIVQWLYFESNNRLENTLLSFNTQTMETRTHPLVKRPQCPVCGDPAIGTHPQPIAFKKKTSFCENAMGGYREVSAEQTLETYQHHVSPITGVMPVLKPYHKIEGSPLYNYSSGRNTALKSKTLFWLNQHMRSGNGGKGKTWAQAKTGALCEAVERYSLTYHGHEPHIVSSLEKLGADGIHPNACMGYSHNQYKNRETINQGYSKFYYLVPVPFDPTKEMDWTPVYSVNEQRFKYLPSCFCYAQYPAQDEFKLYSYPDCNGSAAGNSLEEATLQGFLELVERDCVALWWYNMIPKPAVDLSSFNDPYFNRLMQYYKSLNRSLYVLDLTSDLGIPMFAAVSHRLDDPRQDITFGFGGHVDAKIGVERALIELNQIFPTVNVPEKDRAEGKYRTQDKDFQDWLMTATMENQPYMVPQANAPLKKASDYPRLCEPNIYDGLMFCLDTATKRGLETLVLDLTRPDIGLSVVKVMVPGLRHFWKRLAPGRLYDIPVEMGWLDTPRKEEEMNPVPMFI